jgi:hypothetical protein
MPVSAPLHSRFLVELLRSRLVKLEKITHLTGYTSPLSYIFIFFFYSSPSRLTIDSVVHLPPVATIACR